MKDRLVNSHCPNVGETIEPKVYAAGSGSAKFLTVEKLTAQPHMSLGLNCSVNPMKKRPLRVLLVILVALAVRDLVAELMVLAGQTLALLLESLDVAILGRELFLQSANLTNRAGLRETGGVLAAGLLVTLEQLDAVFETENLEDHDIGTVEDQGQEEGEATEVHVALRVELAGLHLHAVGTEVCGSGV